MVCNTDKVGYSGASTLPKYQVHMGTQEDGEAASSLNIKLAKRVPFDPPKVTLLKVRSDLCDG